MSDSDAQTAPGERPGLAEGYPAAWIFQSHPDYYDLPGALAELRQITWSVNQYAGEIAPGDTVYLWEAGSEAGVLAVARVLEEPREQPASLPDQLFYRDGARLQQDRLRALLEVERVLPWRLPRQALLDDELLRNAKIIRAPAGTNFRLAPTQQQGLDELIDRVLRDHALAEERIFGSGPLFQTAKESGLSTEEQYRIVLARLVAGGGDATMSQLYAAVEMHMGGALLSQQGKGNLRSLIGRGAVQRDFVYPYSASRPAWWITPAGRAWLEANLDALYADAAAAMLREHRGGPMALAAIYEQARERGLLAEPVSQDELVRAMQRDMDRFVDLGGQMWRLADTAEQAAPEREPAGAPEPAFVPQIYAGSDTGFWRIHQPVEIWPEVRRTGVVGFDLPLDSTNQSAQRFRRIKLGDRVVVYLRGAQIGGLGLVTRAAYDANATPEGAAGLFGGAYATRIQVAWADAPAEPADLYQQLTRPAHTDLYNRLKNPHTVMPLSRDDYVELLALLGVDDVGQPPSESRLPKTWADLASFVQLAQRLEQRLHSADELAAAAGCLDADTLVEDLRQLRLIGSAGPERYQPRAYTQGDSTALQRLSALALLVPLEGSPDQYTLPARLLAPRLRAAAEPQPHETFAPELGQDGPRLLRWYRQAGLVQQNSTDWRTAPGALDPLPGDDPATLAYNRFLDALLRELDGTLPREIAPADGPLPPVDDLAGRLRELGRELLIDEQIVRRIYRSLMAGRHVVLSGPPGTGKTELARRLPSLLWREPPQTVVYLTETLDEEPVYEQTVERQGYAAVVVTATEDWGVRDVVGGIGPQLDSAGRLGYTIQHGALTRVVLQHYEGTDGGRKLPAQLPPARRDHAGEDGRRYRGAWLVIDEFTRAPIDAAFGGLLTTLSGGESARLGVPSAGGEQVEVPLPPDFRIIATLNSFDRHFLNQISEALKRRFDFIDVPPPPPRLERYEQGIAAAQALRRLRDAGFKAAIRAANDPPAYIWGIEGQGAIIAAPMPRADGLQRYVLHAGRGQDALGSFWRIFRAIRVFRQLGTAQAVAVYTNLFSGVLVAGMGFEEALDSALADSLADQLQVLTRDEQQALVEYLLRAGDPAGFTRALKEDILAALPGGRRLGLLGALREAERRRHGASDIGDDHAQLSEAQAGRVFDLGQPLALPASGLFLQRLRDLLGERGL